LMGSSPAGAATTPGVMHYGANNDAGQASTGLSSTNAKFSLHVRNPGLGHGIVGEATNADANGFGVVGTGIGGAGVVGGTKGDGATFTGKTPQVQLVPSSDAAHPPSGSAGQLFVDRSNRLWFCRGGTNWRQLA